MRHWPLYGLRLRTPRLELRLPTMDELDELADVADAGLHDPGLMPFARPWSLSPTLGRDILQRHLGNQGTWRPDDWKFNLVAFLDGRPVGTQGIWAEHFAVVREVASGSWLGREFQGRGLGTEMRAALLHLAFEGLGADSAVTGSHPDNPSSIGVTLKLGYRPNGVTYAELQGRKVEELRYRLDRDAWAAHRSVPVELEGLTPEALRLFGA
ncbi:GNAT family N-acetyltransferase [Actinocorallia longicatena]|uniref:GNAT family protein n=1 Tax=Actinocorallia longicatena TaxID=111803 RepID=A0ABP6QEE8_9ACTN